MCSWSATGGNVFAWVFHIFIDEPAHSTGLGQKKQPRGSVRGVAFHFKHRSYVAQVAEVAVSNTEELRMNRVAVVTDTGAQIINPSGTASFKAISVITP